MPRKRLIRSTCHPYHITARGNNKEIFPCSPEVTWRIFSDNFCKIQRIYKVKIHAFVLMPNHFHLLMTVPEEDLGVVMQHFMSSLTKSVNRIAGRSGRVFGSPYHWSLIDNLSYLDIAFKYVYRNPVKAGIADNVSAYQFSTLDIALNKRLGSFSLEPVVGLDSLVPNKDSAAYLDWLNQPFQNEQYKGIQKAFKKGRFLPVKMVWKKERINLFDSTFGAVGIQKVQKVSDTFSHAKGV